MLQCLTFEGGSVTPNRRLPQFALAAALAIAAATSLFADGRERDRHEPEEQAHLPLGPRDLSEFRVSQRLASGVMYTRIERGAASPHDYFTVFIFKRTLDEAGTLSQQIGAVGFDAQIEVIAERAFDDPTTGPLGWRVTSGRFPTMEAATARRDALAAAGFTLIRVVYTGEDGQPTTGPWVVHVLEVDPQHFRGQLSPVLGSGIVPDNQPLSGIAAVNGALAAINGGYFVIGSADGTPGDLAGISVIGGNLVSEAVRNRTSLILPDASGRHAHIAELSTNMSATAEDGATRVIDGLNRKPGLIRGCGGTGDAPTDAPKHDFTCTDAGELILFRPIFGGTTDPGPGMEAVLSSNGTVVDVRMTRGGPIPVDGSVLAATGDATAWLLDHARRGLLVDVRLRISGSKHLFLRNDELGIVNGGPRLLSDEHLDISAAAEGFHQPDDPEFYYRFGGRRNPRTLAGVTKDGRLLLVAVDGRRPGYSVGASFVESAQLMQGLGAEGAVNLDGGGSTTITIGAAVVNQPSDSTGERPIADAIIVRP